MMTFESMNCEFVGCENHRFCSPAGATDGMTFKVLSVEPGEVRCPKGKSLRIVSLE
jgi:uncharacterized protein (UPF0179 family)